jgi:hypothetical protein
VVTNTQSSLTFTNLTVSTNSTSTTQAALTVFGNQTNYGNFQAANVGVQYNLGNSYIGVLSGAVFALGLKVNSGIDYVACFGYPLHLDSPTVSVTNNLFVGNTITATNGFVWPKTNAAPTGVTWGVTAPDYWVTNTVQGVLVLMPCWINR